MERVITKVTIMNNERVLGSTEIETPVDGALEYVTEEIDSKFGHLDANRIILDVTYINDEPTIVL